jgi:Flp pilus assembly pilin Flp
VEEQRVTDICRKIWIRVMDERGASLVEYSLLVALIAIDAFAAMAFFGESVSSSYGDSSSQIINAPSS